MGCQRQWSIPLAELNKIMKTKVESQGRGQLTERIKKRSVELLGYEISQRELRLMPYLQYELMNSKKLNPDSVNVEEREILNKWMKMGYIVDGISKSKGRPLMNVDSKFEVTKEFWVAMLEILWLGYVDLH